MLICKPKKYQPLKGNRFLISVTVHGSSGPIRFVVNEENLVAHVIDTVLKSYAREVRLPVLGSNFNNFILYYPIAGTEDFDECSEWDFDYHECPECLGDDRFSWCLQFRSLQEAENRECHWWGGVFSDYSEGGRKLQDMVQ